MKTALLIIDVQNFFINKWTQQVPKNIVRLIEGGEFAKIIFTKFVNTADSNFVKQFNYTGCAKPPYSDIVKDLEPWVKKDNVFTKNTYSAFLQPADSAGKPGLAEFLKKNRLEEITVVGIDTENCVLTNARELFDRGYKVKVISEGCASSTGGPAQHEAALKIIKNNIGQVI
ncbi:MAG: cysteine hydrolase [Candidatus Komeilibacteria bacterium]|nr:cysteine hydrolase [Candidatus Komeilibacteria bacterium]